MNLKLSQKNDNIKRFLTKLIDLLIHHLNFVLVITFLVPWIYGQIAINELSEVITIIEVFVLISAVLALLTFAYISSMTLNKDMKTSMIFAGESFFMATIQFIAGLGLFLLINLFINQFLGQFHIVLNFSREGIISLFLLLIQLIGIYEVASASSNFLKAIFEVYRQFRKKL
jgi:hypothetical protein